MAVSDTDLATAEGLRETIRQALTKVKLRDTFYYPNSKVNAAGPQTTTLVYFCLPDGIYETVDVLCQRHDGSALVTDVIELEPVSGSSKTIGGRTLTLTISNRIGTLQYTGYSYSTEGIVGVFGTRNGGGLTF